MRKLNTLAFVMFAVTILFVVADIFAFSAVGDAILAEKRITVEKSLHRIGDYINSQAEYYGDWDTDIWQDGTIIDYMAAYDAEEMTFAAVYRQNGETITRQSERTLSYEGSAFDPLNYSEFTDAVRGESDRGSLELSFTPKGDKERTMYTYWRRSPDPAKYDGEYLLVVAISKYTVLSQLPTTIYFTIYGEAVAVGIMSALMLAWVGELRRKKQSSVYGHKYRKEEHLEQ